MPNRLGHGIYYENLQPRLIHGKSDPHQLTHPWNMKISYSHRSFQVLGFSRLTNVLIHPNISEHFLKKANIRISYLPCSILNLPAILKQLFSPEHFSFEHILGERLSHFMFE
jgi:hypothetical protein